MLFSPSLVAYCSNRSRRGTNVRVAFGCHILLVVGLLTLLLATSKQFAQTANQRAVPATRFLPLLQNVILYPCPDASGSQIAIHSARKQGDVGIEGGNVGRVVEDAGRAADVEDGAPVAARGHVVGEETGQGEDGVQCRTQRRGVILQNAPGGVGVVLTKVGVAYDHIHL